MSVVLVGISHHRAPVELRERAALDPSAQVSWRTSLPATEKPFASRRATAQSSISPMTPWNARKRRRRQRLLELEEKLGPALYRLHDEAAALHLFRVAAGLDSMVPGEGEILGQVRRAHEVGAAGPHPRPAVSPRCAGREEGRSETAIAENPASVSSAAAALAEQVFGDLRGRSILVIGAGKVGELAVRNLVTRGATIAFVANRTHRPGCGARAALRREALPLDQVDGELAQADVVLSSTSSSGWVLTREQVERALPQRRGRPLFLIDLAVPRDLDPTIHELDGCYLYNIDDLEAVVAETLAGRRREAERAEAIVGDEVERFREWQASLDVVPAIASLRAHAEEIRAAELERAKLNDSERRAAESVTAAVLNKLLHLPTIRMKEAAAAADGVIYAHAVRHLFGLEDER